MQQILDFLRSTHEWEHFGWNGSTFVAFGINLLAAYQALGVKRQSDLIRNTRSVEGVSLVSMVFFFFYYIAFLIYGFATLRLSPVLVSYQTLFYAPLLYHAWNYSDPNARRRMLVSTALFAPLPVVMALADKGTMVLVLLLVILALAFHILYRLIIARTSESVSFIFLLAFLANSIFWAGYGFVLGDPVFIALNILMAIVMVIAIGIFIRKYDR